MARKSKPKVDTVFNCPHCDKRVHYVAGEETISPAVKAEKKPYEVIEKDSQTDITRSDTWSKDVQKEEKRRGRPPKGQD